MCAVCQLTLYCSRGSFRRIFPVVLIFHSFHNRHSHWTLHMMTNRNNQSHGYMYENDKYCKKHSRRSSDTNVWGGSLSEEAIRSEIQWLIKMCHLSLPKHGSPAAKLVSVRPRAPQNTMVGNSFFLRGICLGQVSCGLFHIQSKSQPTKKKKAVAKSGPNATFNLFFLGLGWPRVGEFVGFIMAFICFTTQHNLVYRTLLIR